MEDIDDWLANRLLGRPRARKARQLEIGRLRLSEALDQGESTNAKVAFKLGHAYFRLENLDLAHEYVSSAVKLDPKNAAWHYRLGFIQERLKLWTEALHSYTSATGLDPHRAEWFYRKAQCEQSLGEKVAAQESLRSAIHLTRAMPNSIRVWENC